MATSKFPHFYRTFAARLFQTLKILIIWGLVTIFFISIGPWEIGLSPTFEHLKRTALTDYKNPQIHLALAKEYRIANDFGSARRELIVGLSFDPQNKDMQQALEEVESFMEGPSLTMTKIEGWEKISRDYPGYRDAYLKLAQLYFSLYQNERAQENLDRALQLDANFKPARELEKILRN